MVKFEKKRLHNVGNALIVELFLTRAIGSMMTMKKRSVGHELIENMLRPYERIIIPDWCPLRILELKA